MSFKSACGQFMLSSRLTYKEKSANTVWWLFGENTNPQIDIKRLIYVLQILISFICNSKLQINWQSETAKQNIIYQTTIQVRGAIHT